VLLRFYPRIVSALIAGVIVDWRRFVGKSEKLKAF
jgi:hypothetical protein